jgi:hypothetical protein
MIRSLPLNHFLQVGEPGMISLCLGCHEKFYKPYNLKHQLLKQVSLKGWDLV